MGKYKVLIKPSAVKELDDIPKKDLQKITQKIRDLSENPRPHGCQKLSGEKKYRIRQGDYRVIYSIDDDRLTVLVVKVAHRREVYR